MKIVVVDGMGGGIGKAVISHLRAQSLTCEIVAVGINSAATNAMLKAGADVAATGENAVIYNCGKADIIIGPLGIAFANSLHGEISPRMALAVSESDAQKILLPVSRCNAMVVGVKQVSITELLQELTKVIGDFHENRGRASL